MKKVQSKYIQTLQDPATTLKDVAPLTLQALTSEGRKELTLKHLGTTQGDRARDFMHILKSKACENKAQLGIALRCGALNQGEPFRPTVEGYQAVIRGFREQFPNKVGTSYIAERIQKVIGYKVDTWFLAMIEGMDKAKREAPIPLSKRSGARLRREYKDLSKEEMKKASDFLAGLNKKIAAIPNISTGVESRLLLDLEYSVNQLNYETSHWPESLRRVSEILCSLIISSGKKRANDLALLLANPVFDYYEHTAYIRTTREEVLDLIRKGPITSNSKFPKLSTYSQSPSSKKSGVFLHNRASGNIRYITRKDTVTNLKQWAKSTPGSMRFHTAEEMLNYAEGTHTRIPLDENMKKLGWTSVWEEKPKDGKGTRYRVQTPLGLKYFDLVNITDKARQTLWDQQDAQRQWEAFRKKQAEREAQKEKKAEQEAAAKRAKAKKTQIFTDAIAAFDFRRLYRVTRPRTKIGLYKVGLKAQDPSPFHSKGAGNDMLVAINDKATGIFKGPKEVIIAMITWDSIDPTGKDLPRFKAVAETWDSLTEKDINGIIEVLQDYYAKFTKKSLQEAAEAHTYKGPQGKSPDYGDKPRPLSKVLKVLQATASRDEGRPTLNSVNFQEYNGRWEALATDGHRALIVPVKKEGWMSDQVYGLTTPGKGKRVWEKIPRSELKNYSFPDLRGVLYSLGEKAIIDVEAFKNALKAIERSFPTNPILNVKPLARAQQSRHVPARSQQIGLNFKNGAVELIWSDQKPGCGFQVGEGATKTATIWFRGSYIKEAIYVLQGRFVAMSYLVTDGGPGPLIFDDSDGGKAVVMPLRIQ